MNHLGASCRSRCQRAGESTRPADAPCPYPAGRDDLAGMARTGIWVARPPNPGSAYVLWSLGVNATSVGESVVSYRGGCCGEIQRRGAG